MELELHLAKPKTVSGTPHDNDSIIVELGDEPVVLVVQSQPLADSFELDQLLQRLSTNQSAHSVDTLLGHFNSANQTKRSQCARGQSGGPLVAASGSKCQVLRHRSPESEG